MTDAEDILPPESPAEGGEPTGGTSLQIGDIESVVRVIDYAADQGTFKGWKVMEEVLVLRNRLVAFLHAAEQAQEFANNSAAPQETIDDGLPPESPAGQITQK